MKKDAGTNVKGPKEVEYKELKAKTKYQGGSNWESTEQRESCIIQEVENT